MKLGLGICGSIAAYKSVDLLKELKAEGFEVQCVLTAAAEHFVSPLVLESFSGQRVLKADIFDASHFGTEHIHAARSQDAFLIYGVTANFLAKLALGLADDFLSLQILAFNGPVYLAPAMNPTMWSQAVVQEHVQNLKKRGFQFLGPIDGLVACGESGVGHLESHQNILEALKGLKKESSSSELEGKKVLISIGPMKTQIDPVRFLQNRSSGLTGLYLAQEARKRGAKLSILLGPVASEISMELKKLGDVYHYDSPKNYESELFRLFPKSDIFLSAAAVLDFEIIPHDLKIEKTDLSNKWELLIQPVKDFVAEVSKIKTSKQKIIAFALQSGEAKLQLEKAWNKLRKKNADALLLNSVEEGQGPDAEKSHFKCLFPNGELIDLGLGDKKSLSVKIWDSLKSLV